MRTEAILIPESDGLIDKLVNLIGWIDNKRNRQPTRDARSIPAASGRLGEPRAPTRGTSGASPSAIAGSPLSTSPKGKNRSFASASSPTVQNESKGGFLLGTILEDNPESGRYKGMLAIRSERLMREYEGSNPNRNVLIFGPPGSGKTSSIMVPNIFETMRQGKSMFLTDPKGELKAITEPVAKLMGYTIRTFNLINPRDSDGWNIMEWLASLKDDQQQWVSTIGNMIIQNTTPPDSHADPFFESAAEALLKALMYFILEITTPTEDIQDSNIDRINEAIDKWRNQNVNTYDPNEKEFIQSKIYNLQKQKKVVVSDRIKRVQEDLSVGKLTGSEIKTANEAIRRLERFREEQEIIELPEAVAAPDYECYTIAEAKALMRNLSTCIRLLEYPFDDEKKNQSGGPGSQSDTDPRMSASQELLRKSRENAAKERTRDGRVTNEAFSIFFSELRFDIDPGENQTNILYRSLNQIFSILGEQKGIANLCYIGFRNSPNNARASAQMTLLLRLNAYTQKDIMSLTSRNDIDILEAGRSKCIYYCLLRDSDTSLAYISAQFINTALVRLQAMADSMPNRRLLNDVEFYLDEFPNIGYLPAFTIKLSTYRSRGIHFILAIQSFPQLLERYSENLAHEIMGDCLLQIFLGCGDVITGRLISELYGIMTTATTAYRETQNKLALFADLETSKAENEGARNIMNIDELLRLGARGSKQIIISYHGEIIKLERYPYYQYPGFSAINKLIQANVKIPAVPRKSALDGIIDATDVPISVDSASRTDTDSGYDHATINGVGIGFDTGGTYADAASVMHEGAPGLIAPASLPPPITLNIIHMPTGANKPEPIYSDTNRPASGYSSLSPVQTIQPDQPLPPLPPQPAWQNIENQASDRVKPAKPNASNSKKQKQTAKTLDNFNF